VDADQRLAICGAIGKGEPEIASDGSFDPVECKSAYGLVFASASASYLTLSGPCTGSTAHYSAIRAELCGILGAVYLLQGICSYPNISSGAAALYTDSAKAIKLLNEPGRKFKRFLVDSYDLINEILEIQKQVHQRIRFNLRWVKGHYKRKNRRLEHILNSEAHRLATSFQVEEKHMNIDISPPSLLASLHLQFSLTSQWQQVVYEAAHEAILRITICKNASWTDTQFEMADWDEMYGYLKRLPRTSFLKYCKLLHGIINTNEQNRKYYGKSDTCPHCQSSSESFIHVMSCPNKEVSHYRAKQQRHLWKQLQSKQTPAIVVNALKMGIMSSGAQEYRDHTIIVPPTSQPCTPPSSQDPIVLLVNQVVDQQTLLGWDQFHKGRISKLWKEVVFRDSMSRNRWIDKRKWASEVARSVLNNSLSLWKFRCACLHGQTTQEVALKQLQKLQTAVS
jgi:ribonuclease HI